MFLINNMGRVVDLPARMEESGFQQAREVLSISSQLMRNEPSGVTMTDLDAINLKNAILRKFPSVVTDEEYLELHPRETPPMLPQEPISMEQIKKVQGIVSPTVEPQAESIVNLEMTKDGIIAQAVENKVSLNNTEKRLNKEQLVKLINSKHAENK